ncbi:ADP-ribosylglycohydrolase family protein [Trinickia fusca]|uniref:ADP-ribosylglycohydrolase family protein n=1 Tax=Trinickia fusca TaxID=2419777 RepID=UPI001FE244AD|nr:ADP-ribosylglycohydrolase family protein [Trinickia fusca]
MLTELQTCTPSGGGYVVDTLAGALWTLQQLDYAAVVRAAIALGNDTDTTAAVAGGLAGIVHGIEGIPSVWLDRLAGADLVASAEERLLRRLSL